MTKPTSDFGVEKRRHWYAIIMGVVNASVTIIVLFFRYGVDDDSTPLVYFGFWTLIFILTFGTAFALWSRQNYSKLRAIMFSFCAVAISFLALSSLNMFIYGPYNFYGLMDIFDIFIEAHLELLGLPYLGALVVGLKFARPAQDVREHF